MLLFKNKHYLPGQVALFRMTSSHWAVCSFHVWGLTRDCCLFVIIFPTPSTSLPWFRGRCVFVFHIALISHWLSNRSWAISKHSIALTKDPKRSSHQTFRKWVYIYIICLYLSHSHKQKHKLLKTQRLKNNITGSSASTIKRVPHQIRPQATQPGWNSGMNILMKYLLTQAKKKTNSGSHRRGCLKNPDLGEWEAIHS